MLTKTRTFSFLIFLILVIKLGRAFKVSREERRAQTTLIKFWTNNIVHFGETVNHHSCPKIVQYGWKILKITEHLSLY